MSGELKTKVKIFFSVLILGTAVFALGTYSKDKLSSKEETNAKAEVVFLNVGQGDAILIQQNRTQILIDGGKGQEILNRLGETMPLSDKEIDLVVATHPDEDHLGGLIKVLESYKVDEILESGIACDKDLCAKWDELISKNNIPVLHAKLGQEIDFGDEIQMAVLYPFEDLSGKTFKNTNEASLVLKADVAGQKYLLTGDTEDKTEKNLLASNVDLDADMLKVSHHGSKSATSAEFLQAVTPEKAVISVGKNSYGHPAEEVLNRLRNMNVEILRTDEAGNIRF